MIGKAISNVKQLEKKLLSLLNNKKFSDAAILTRDALARNPHWAEGHALLGEILKISGDPHDSAAAFEQAAIRCPERIDWQIEKLSQQIRSRNNVQEVIPQLVQILIDNVDDRAICLKVAATLTTTRTPTVAIAALKWYLQRHPECDQISTLLGMELINAGLINDGIEIFVRLLQQTPENILYSVALSSALGQIGDFERCESILKAFMTEWPVQRPHLLGNLATAIMNQNRSREAIPLYEEAERAASNNREIKWNLALALLKSGDYDRGWNYHEFRPDDVRYHEDRPWRGETPLKGRTLMLLSEQGMGDTLQFLRYVPFLNRSGARLVVAVQAPLVRLARSLHAEMEVISIDDREKVRHDFTCPLPSLPFVLKPALGTSIPARVPYLWAEKEDIQRMGALLPPRAQRLRIGLVWAGAPRPQYGIYYRARSSTLENFRPITDTVEADFVNLQFGTARSELKAWTGSPIIDVMDAVTDMADTAALVMNLDLVISVDTSVAHLAGALGKPVWMLSRSDCCWRWLENRDDSPWYPTLRIFRSQPGSLDHAIALAADALPQFCRIHFPRQKIEAERNRETLA